jgi:hypothetical protein
MFGTFETYGIVSAELKFRMYVNTEPGYDFLWITAGTGGPTEYGYKVSGNSGGWITGTLNLNNVDGLGTSLIGFPAVRIWFKFTSDYLTNLSEGAYVDDIVLRFCTASYCTSNYSPSLTSGFSLKNDNGLIYEPVLIQTEP